MSWNVYPLQPLGIGTLFLKAFGLQDLHQWPLSSQAFTLSLGVTPLALLVLSPLDSIVSPGFLDLQLLDTRLWDFLASIAI